MKSKIIRFTYIHIRYLTNNIKTKLRQNRSNTLNNVNIRIYIVQQQLKFIGRYLFEILLTYNIIYNNMIRYYTRWINIIYITLFRIRIKPIEINF